MLKQYGIRKYPNRLNWYVWDYWNKAVVSTPWYSRESAQRRADWYNEDEEGN